MKKVIEIGELKFTTQKSAILFYRKILNNSPVNQKLSGEDFESVFSLLKKHPDAKRKIGNGITEILVKKFKYNKKCFFIKNENGVEERFSYLKCIKGDATALDKFRQACRIEVQDDLIKLKQKIFKENAKKGLVRCQETNELTNYEGLHIDHRQPNTFSVIVDRFIEIHKIDLSKIEYIRAEIFGHLLKNRKLAEDFRIYHKEKANLRLVKKEYNLKRTHLGKIQRQKKDLVVE